jgi:uncharacterized protein
MNRKQSSVEHNMLMMKIQKILAHYICPDMCDAKCCNYSPINLDNREFHDIIRKVDKESAAIIKSKSVYAPIKSGFFKRLPSACPLLIGLKCRIYENRPEICKNFPFETTTSLDYVLYLRICPLSMIIIHDYVQFLNLSNESEKASLFTEIYEKHKNTDIVSINIIKLDKHDIDLFDSFISFLETNK